MRRDSAETLALRALAWLAGNDDLLPVFMGSTGATAADLRKAGDRPEVLASVLDFILANDAWVIACAGAMGTAPERIAAARAALPGGEAVHWT